MGREVMPAGRVYAVSMLGSGSWEEDRILTLLSAFRPTAIPFDRTAKWRGFRRILATLWRERPDLIAVEGTGVGRREPTPTRRPGKGRPGVRRTGRAVCRLGERIVGI